MKAQKDNSANGGNNRTGVRTGKMKKSKSKVNFKKTSSKPVSQEMNNMDEHEESPEVLQYLDKLQEMVPIMPKDKRLTNFEVITQTINYIRDLRDTLGLPQFDVDSNEDEEESEVTFEEQLQLSFSSDNNRNPAVELDNFSTPSKNQSDYLSTLSLSVSTSPSSPNSNEENFVQQTPPNLTNSTHSRRQPFFAISNLNGSPNDPNTLSLQESLPLKQISCLL